jgi:hypothetical protein
VGRIGRLEWLARAVEAAHRLQSGTALRFAVDAALAEPPPLGHPAELGYYGHQLADAGGACDRERLVTTGLARQALPDLWLGRAAVAATDAMSTLDGALGRAVEALDEGAAALKALSSGLTEAQGRDELGRGPLRHAKQLLDHRAPAVAGLDDGVTDRACAAARDGIGHLIAAARLADEAGRLAARRLGELAAEAHTAGLTTGSLTDLDKVVLTGASVPGPAGLDEFNLILTTDGVDRASDRLDGLPPEDRRRFTALLAGSLSVQERAYLMQALAAGHSIAAIEAFARSIHRHGADPAWLRDHLTPGHATQGPAGGLVPADVTFDGRAWTQGPRPTCVAAATVFARARLDPLYALELTTGGHPDDPAFDNGDAFARRLLDEQQRVYGDGRGRLDDWMGRDGITDQGTEEVVDAELSDPTGRDFRLVDVNTPEQRRDALVAIEAAVDRGVPVPIGARDDGLAHELVVIGHEGDQLLVYNPWGYSMWLPADAFVDGRLNLIGTGVPATFDDATLPRR